MPPSDRRDRRRLAQRDAIVAAARRIVATDGTAAVTMRRVADAIDYSPASLYAHFANREALLAALCAEGMHALRATLDAAAATLATEPRTRLVALGEAYVAFALERPQTYRLMFMQNETLTKAVFETAASSGDDGARALALFTACFEELIGAGVLPRTADPASLCEASWTAVHGIASLRLACRDFLRTPDAELVEIVVGALARDSTATMGR